ncbi:hypothetical protein FDU21_09025 [Xanthomonas oryzae pv. oryzae]|nr:hypothetical protein FDU21_09025 [Xanthomonas oryzae pv. oryzae]
MMESEECSRTPRLRRRQCGEATQPAEAELHHTCKQAQRMMVMRHVSLVTALQTRKCMQHMHNSAHSRTY